MIRVVEWSESTLKAFHCCSGKPGSKNTGDGACCGFGPDMFYLGAHEVKVLLRISLYQRNVLRGITNCDEVVDLGHIRKTVIFKAERLSWISG